jgi:hypothetical protein
VLRFREDDNGRYVETDVAHVGRQFPPALTVAAPGVLDLGDGADEPCQRGSVGRPRDVQLIVGVTDTGVATCLDHSIQLSERLDWVGQELEEFPDEGKIEALIVEGQATDIALDKLNGGTGGEQLAFIEAIEQSQRMLDESLVDIDTLDMDREVGREFEGEDAEATTDVENA